MALPETSVVNVPITIGTSFPSRAGFGKLNCVTAETGVIGAAERYRDYGTADAVAADWGANSEVTKCATAFFAQQPKPTEFMASVRFDADQAAQLRGGSDSLTVIATWAAITDGSFNITIDGGNEDITAIDFTGDTTLDNVAATIEASLQAVATGGYTAATCTHDGERFFISSGTTGALSEISAFLSTVDPASGTDLVALLDMEQGSATFTNGFVAETVTEALTAIQLANTNWYGLCFTKEVRDLVVIGGEDAVEAASAWVEARVKLFFNCANSLDVLDSVSTTDIAYLLAQNSLRRTITIFSSSPAQYPNASAAGRMFTVNFSQVLSTITLKFKTAPIITVETLNTNQKTVLDSKVASAVVQVGSLSFFSETRVANGAFVDTVHGVDWLTDAVQKEVLGLLVSSTTKIPYTNRGVAQIESAVAKILNEAVRNGLLAPGNTVDGEFLANGWKTIIVDVADVSDTQKQNRIYNGLSFIANGAGAIHNVTINGTFEE